MMWIGFFGLIIGLLLGYLINLPVPAEWASYLSVAALAGMDTAFGGWRASLEGKFHLDVFLSGFIINSLLAALLAYMGDQIGVDLLLAAVVTLGGRMFLNLSLIRRYYLNQIAMLRRQR